MGTLDGAERSAQESIPRHHDAIGTRVAMEDAAHHRQEARSSFATSPTRTGHDSEALDIPMGANDLSIASAAAPGSEKEFHPHFNTILINGVGGIRRLAVIASQIEIAPGEIQLGGIANGVAHANLGIA